MAEKEKTEKDNSVYIGGKEFGRYLTAINIVLSSEKEAILKARGKYTSRAIDAALASKRFSNDAIDIKKIEISTEKMESKDEEGKEKIANISSIEITLFKK